MCQPHYLQYSLFIPHIHFIFEFEVITVIMVQFCPFFSLCSSLGFNGQLVS